MNPAASALISLWQCACLGIPSLPRDVADRIIMVSSFRTCVLLAVALAPLLVFLRRRTRRSFKLPHKNERILILGASSGIGRTLAHQYAALGVRGVCVVGRREDKLAEVVAECDACKGPNTHVFGIAGDIAEAKDMVKLRVQLESRACYRSSSVSFF